MNPLSSESGLTITEVQSFLDAHEWYDNSRLETQQACKRKAYFQQIGPAGVPLAKRVGDGANFGTCMHAAHETYYAEWGTRSESWRRLEAARTFQEIYAELFPNGATQSRHTLANGLDIWDDYCDQCLIEDSLYRPVDPEIGFIVRIAPRPNEPHFRAFWYVGRADGVWQRISQGDYFIGELKTSSGGAERRTKSLTFHRQPVGYVALARELVTQGKFEEVTDPAALIGHFTTVVSIQTIKREVEREFFPDTLDETESWRVETIQMVNEWRARKHLLLEYMNEWAHARRIFYKETEECFKYGQCPYFDLCKFGISADALNDYEIDSWNPLIGSRPLPKKFAEDDETVNLLSR